MRRARYKNIKKFLEKVEQSPELQVQFAKIRAPDEAYKLAASIQDGFTKDEFISEMTKIYEAAIADLSEEDIAKVAGGRFTGVSLTIFSGAMVSILVSVTTVASSAGIGTAVSASAAFG